MIKLYSVLLLLLLIDVDVFPQSPIIVVNPDSLDEELFSGKSTTHVLTINNKGGSDLEFEIFLENVQSSKNEIRQNNYFKANSDNLTGSISSTIPFYRPYNDINSSRKVINTEDYVIYNRDKILTQALNILIITSYSDPSQIKNLLLTNPDIETIDVFDAINNTPNLNQLLPYHCVVLMNNYPFGDPQTLGNVLADYLDAGGSLIISLATFIGGHEVRGRLWNDKYLPFNLGTGPSGSSVLGNFNQKHPIMQGVSNAFGDLLGEVTIAEGADLVAEWINGQPFVATKGKNVAGVNIYVAESGYWTGDIPLIIYNAILWTVGPMWLTADTYDGIVPAGSFMEVTMTFDAANLSGGDYNANIHISSNDPISPVVTVPAYLRIIDAPSITVSADTLNFEDVFLGITDSLEIEVINNGSQNLQISNAITQPSEYSIYPTIAEIDPGENEIFKVAFSPQQAGNCTGTLTIMSNDPLWNNYTVHLNGNGVDPPVIVVNPDSIYIEVLLGTSRAKAMTINNSGASNLSFDLLAMGGGVNNFALKYNGSDSYVKCNDNPSLNIEHSITIEAWIYPFDWNGNSRILQKEIYDNQYRLLAEDNFLRFEVRYVNNGQISANLPPTNEWHHVAGVYDYNSSLMRLFVDGEMVAENLNVIGTINTSTDPLYIGTKYPGAPSGDYFNGIIDEIRIWASARTQAQIRENMSLTLTGMEPGIIGYWQFDEGNGDITCDKTPNENNGILNGGIEWIKSSAPITPGWLSVTPDSGICSPNSSMEINLLFDATELDTGDYYSTIYISNNDPILPLVEVPIYMLVSTTTGIEDNHLIPTSFNIYQNYPNPFNPLTNIKYDLPKSIQVVLKVFNILGEEVVTLVNDAKLAGSYQVSWDASNLSSGLYLYRIKAGDFIETKKMILIK